MYYCVVVCKKFINREEKHFPLSQFDGDFVFCFQEYNSIHCVFSMI